MTNKHPLESVVKVLKFYRKHCAQNSLDGEEGQPTRFPADRALITLREYMAENQLFNSLQESIKEEVEQEKSGYWYSCSGCHESDEGYSRGVWSDIFQTHLGLGCRECGGIGACWGTADWPEIENNMKENPKQDVEVVEGLEEAIKWYTKIPPRADTNLEIVVKAARIQLKRQEGK